MPFMKSPQKNAFTPRIKYSAMTGKWVVSDYDPDARANIDTDVDTPFKALFDLGSIQTGVVHFPAGGAPDVRVVPEGAELPEYPEDTDANGALLFKACMVLKMFSPAIGGVREALLTSAAVRTGVEDLYTTFTAATEAIAGKIPVVLVSPSVPATFGKGPRKTTIYRPLFSIAAWAERVPDFGPRTVRPPTAPAAAMPRPQEGAASAWSPALSARSLEDELPFAPCWQ